MGKYLVCIILLSSLIPITYSQEIEEIRTRSDVFGFEPLTVLDFPFETEGTSGPARHYSTYGYWGGKKFFLICNPRLMDLDHIENQVVKAGENGFVKKASHTDLYAALDTEMTAFAEILRIESVSSLESAVKSLQEEEGDFLVLTVDVPEIRNSNGQMAVRLAFKLYGLSFAPGSRDEKERGKLERCEFLYGDSAHVRRPASKSTIATFTACIAEAIYTKLAHSFVARVLGNEESPWNPQKDLFTIAVPGPSIGFYLNYAAWKQCGAGTWKDGECPPSDYQSLKAEGRPHGEEEK